MGSENIFKRVRLFLGLTQIQAAERLETTQSTISKLENDKKATYLEDIQDLVRSSNYIAEIHIRNKETGELSELKI